MNQQQALQIKAELLEYCRKYGLWVEETVARKPEIKDIVLTISLRITERGGA